MLPPPCPTGAMPNPRLRILLRSLVDSRRDCSLYWSAFSIRMSRTPGPTKRVQSLSSSPVTTESKIFHFVHRGIRDRHDHGNVVSRRRPNAYAGNCSGHFPGRMDRLDIKPTLDGKRFHSNGETVEATGAAYLPLVRNWGSVAFNGRPVVSAPVFPEKEPEPEGKRATLDSLSSFETTISRGWSTADVATP